MREPLINLYGIDELINRIEIGDILNLRNIRERETFINLCRFEHLVKKLLPVDTLNMKSIITGKNTRCEMYVIRFTPRHDIKIISLEDHSTHKKSFSPVPPDISSVREGIAWSFDIPETYVYDYES